MSNRFAVVPVETLCHEFPSSDFKSKPLLPTAYNLLFKCFTLKSSVVVPDVFTVQLVPSVEAIIFPDWPTAMNLLSGEMVILPSEVWSDVTDMVVVLVW